MSRSLPSNATHEMLVWCRKKAGLTAEYVADVEKVSAETLAAWENGTATPTLAMLKRLAKRYKRPLMVFYLPKPPTDFTVVNDFRLLQAGVSRTLSPELLHAIRVAQERQAWAAGYLEDEGFAKSALVGCVTESADTQTEARRLRNRLGVTVADQTACSTAREAFNLWRSRCEAAGIYVFQSTRVEMMEMRGCALPDSYAPAALVNSKDFATAKTFTLMHEVAHILLGKAAITGAGKYAFALAPSKKIERFCNQFAAEVLVPARHFVSLIPPNWRNNDDAIIKQAASRYWVSRAVIGLRLVETGLATKEYLQSKWPSLQVVSKVKKPTTGGPLQHVLARSKTGDAFARLALSAYDSGEIHGGELSSLLGMKLKHLARLESKLYPSRVQPLMDMQSS